jgi:DNA polymerase-1
MKRNELLKLLDNLVEEQETPSSNRYDRVLLIDGLNLFFRNFAMMNIVNSQGVHVGGLGGFMRSLGSLINQIQPTSVFVVFDGMGSSTNRKNLLPEYKSGRNLARITNWEVFEDLEDEDDAKITQIVRIAHYLKCLPVKTVAIDKAEADDIIAYYSDILPKKYSSKCFIVSSDKDFIQLINDDVIVYRPIEREYYTKSTVEEKFGVLADNFILYKMLLGDNSDKIPGVKGLGAKGLMKKFPELAERVLTLDELFEISEQKHKEHVVYARIAFERDRLEQNYKIMNLKKPLLDDNDKEFLEAFAEDDTLVLNTEAFLRFYHDDGLGHLIKNVEFWVNDTFKVLNSFNK